eukprot:3034339-Amphidinium_carterae.1
MKQRNRYESSNQISDKQQAFASSSTLCTTENCKWNLASIHDIQGEKAGKRNVNALSDWSYDTPRPSLGDDIVDVGSKTTSMCTHLGNPGAPQPWTAKSA